MIINDSLEIRLASPDYQEDWGPVGDPEHVTLTRYRSQPAVLELGISADSPVRELLMRDGCAVQVKFRDRTEFLGHVYMRQGGVAPDAPVKVFARAEDEVFDQTLAWVMPRALSFAGSFGGLYSSGKIEPEVVTDSAQAFPDPWLDPGHFMWGIPWITPSNAAAWPTFDWADRPQKIGSFLATIFDLNLVRVGYQRGTLFAGSAAVRDVTPSAPGYAKYVTAGAGAPQTIVTEEGLEAWARPIDPPPWVSSFAGAAPRFQTLREVANVFQTWADTHSDESFNLFVDGEIGKGAYGIRVGFRPGLPTYPVPLTVTAGTVIDGSWSIADHAGSRVVLGGPGEQEARLFQERRMLDRESYGRVIEIFKDATGAKLQAVNKEGYAGFAREYFVDATVPDGYKVQARGYFDQQGARYLSEAAPETTVEVELQETGEIYYGGESGYQLGQKVVIDLGWTTFEKRVERVTISLTKNEGLTVTPFVGSEVASSDEAQARALRALANAQRRDQSER